MHEGVDRPYERLSSTLRVGYLHLRQGTLHQAMPLLERAVALGQEDKSPPLGAQRCRVSGADLRPGGPRHGRPVLAGADRGTLPSVLSSVGRHLSSSERWRRPTGWRSVGSRTAQEHTSRGEEARALWLLSAIAMRRDPSDMASAETAYLQALTLAEELGMRPLQAHCHRGLGTMYAATGQQEQARAALSSAVAMYQSMAMRLWLPRPRRHGRRWSEHTDVYNVLQ